MAISTSPGGRWRARLLSLAVGLFAALLLAGCSAVSIGYNNLPTVVNWYADGYFDLDVDQETALKERIVALRQWHRTSQLPDYGRFLGEVKARVRGPVSPDDVVWLYAEGQKRYRVLGEHLAPDLADLAFRLTPDNIRHLERKQAKGVTEYERDYITASPEKRRERRYERILSEAERWYGSFGDAQRDRIRILTDALPANYPLVVEDRKRRQRELHSILRAAAEKTAPREEVARRLRQWVLDWERGRSPVYREFAARYTAQAQKLFAEIANLATPQQRETAQKRLQNYIDEIAALSAESG